MSELNTYDYLNYAQDKEILSLIGNETLYFSNKIQKINHSNISQERTILVTNKGIYNLQKKKLKRKLKYSDIRGITFTKLSHEFVVHGKDGEYDYYYQSPDKNTLICLIAKFYEEETNSNLKLCEIQEKSLKNFVTLKKEKKKDENFSKMDDHYLINTKSLMKEVLRADKKLRQIMKDNVSDSDEENSKKEKITIIFNNEPKIKQVQLEDFQIMKILGRGAYDKVYLVQYKHSDTYYAMKSIKKEYLKDVKEINSIKNLNIQNLNYQFLIGIKLCFTTEERIYFIMNLIDGEDLLSFMKYHVLDVDENQIKFYAVIIGLAIDYLHNNGIVLKDLRLDNIIIDKDGYLKITNFKMNQLFKMKQKYILTKETSEFLAPEVITSEPKNECGKESDWWSYGVILYELLFGIPPFYSNDDNKIKEEIIKKELRFPENSRVSEEGKDLMKLLLKKDKEERIGSKNGFDEIKNHKFFEDINIDDIINKKSEPNYKPISGSIFANKENVIEFTYEDLINSRKNINQ